MKPKSSARFQVVPEKVPYDENLRLWLENHIKETGLTTTELARSIGGSRTGWDLYLKCQYFGFPDPKNGNRIRTTDNSKYEPMLRAYRSRVDGPNAANRSEFVKTTAWHQIRAAITTSIEENSISLVIGGYGKGKSRCANEFVYKKLKQPVVFIFCSPNITTRYFLQKIARELKITNASFTIPQLEDEIVEHLKNHPRVIVVDQANYLPPKALGSISYIWEASGAPVTLIGTQTLKDNFFSPKMTSDERGQLASRVALVYSLRGLDLATVKAVCHRVMGKEVATDKLVKTIFEKVGGSHTDEEGDMLTANFRSLEFRLRRLLKLMKLNPDMSIDELMKKADEMLLAA